MTTKTIRYRDLEALLMRLGFQRKPTTGPQVVYTYPDNKALFMFPPHRPDDRVPNYHLASARTQLELRGILPGEEFDKLGWNVQDQETPKKTPCSPKQIFTSVEINTYLKLRDHIRYEQELQYVGS